MKGVILKLSKEDVELLKKYDYKEEASLNGELVAKNTAITINNIVASLKRKEKGNAFGL